MPSNFFKTGLLLLALTGIFVATGAAVGGRSGLWIAFFIALGTNILTYWKSDQMVLKMQGAQEVDARTAPDFYRLVGMLAQRAGLPQPRVYIMNSAQPNAFATGRNPQNAAVCASTGLLDLLTPEEVSGVLAHELAHVKNRDTLTMTIAASIGGAISLFANMLQFGMLFGGGRNQRGGYGGTLLAALVAPIAATLVQMAISRSREYQADAIGARLCGNPLWLASALTKIQSAVRGGMRMMSAERMPATAQLFIINPLTGRGVDNLFSTHPSTENRVAELEKLAAEMGITSVHSTSGSGKFVPEVAPATGRTLRPTWGGTRGPWG